MISVDCSHPMLDGVRVFAYPDSAAAAGGWVNLNPKWVFRFAGNTGLTFTSRFGSAGGPHPAIQLGSNTYTGAAGTVIGYFSHWADVWPSDDNKDWTVICRFLWEGSDPGSNNVAVAVGARGNSLQGGFMFGPGNNGTTSGLACYLHATNGTRTMLTDGTGVSTLTNVPMVAAFTFRGATGEYAFFQNGNRTLTGTNTTQTWTPYSAETGVDFGLGVLQAFNGYISWAVVKSGVMSEQEIRDWSRDECWPFVWPDPPFVLEVATGSYTTDVTVASTLAPSTAGAVTYLTTVDAEAFIEGDFDVGPEPPAVGTFVTTIGVGSAAYYDSPEFGVFITLVGVGSQITATAPVTFTTSVGVRSDARGLIDGRADLIDTSHYRR